MTAAEPAAPGADRRGYRPELDVLRAFAFLAVFISHWMPNEPSLWLARGLSPSVARALVAVSQWGEMGVMLFFCLSSYLITGLLLREIQARGRVDVRAFYLRRVLRIWPLYLAFIALAAALPLVDATQHFGWKAGLAFLFFSGNWIWALGTSLHTVALPLWSVSVEEQFYLVWPWIVRRATAPSLRRTAFALLVIAAANRVLVVSGVLHVDLWHNTLTQLDAIALGALLALGTGERAERARRRYRGTIIAAAVSALLLLQLLRSPDTDPRNLLFYPLVSLCCAIVLFAAIDTHLDLSSRRVRTLIYLGKISYGLYVVHYCAFYCVENILHQSPVKLSGMMSFAARGALTMALTIAVASASYRWLETPFMRLKSKYGRPATEGT